jgi:hypothetical protein
MKSLLWKEWRENFKWAALALFVSGGLAWFFMYDPPWPESLMHSGFLLIMSLVSAAFAAILGFLQIFTEAGGDRRALLLHRPLGRGQIFLAKTAAGLGLYVLALGLPFACAVSWVATPGHSATPFRWPLALPWLADILTGCVYYFAGMLMAQREARWYGGRGLPLVTALFGSLLVHCLPEFRDALLTILILGTLQGVAAWGSFVSGGDDSVQPRLAKIALAGTFLTGLLVVGVCALLVIGAFFSSNVRQWYQLDRQGRMLIVRAEEGEHTVTDLDGRLPHDLQGKNLDSHALREMETPLTGLGPFPRVHWYRLYDRLFMPMPSHSPFGERWFYVADEGRLLGYDWRSKRLIGSLGPDGFAAPGQAAGQRFHGELFYKARYFFAVMGAPDFLPFSDGVYTVDPGQRTIHSLVLLAQGQRISHAARRENERQKVTQTFVLGDNVIRAVDEAGTPVFAAPVSYDLQNYTLEVGQLENPSRLVAWYQSHRAEGDSLGAGKLTLLLLSNFAFQFLPAVWDQAEPGDNHLVEYDAGGRILKRQTVPPLSRPEPSLAQTLYGLVMPPAGVLLYGVAWRSCFPPAAGWTSGLGTGRVLAALVLMGLSALVCALSCFLLARRSAFAPGRRLGWALCGLLWGPAGLLLMLALQDWPARVACPGCRKPRVVTRAHCEHCGAAQAAPAADGTEIFEDSAAPPAALIGR